MKKGIIILVILSFVVHERAFTQNLSSVEEKLIKTVEANNEEALVLLERVVNINSGTMNTNGVRKVGKVFQDAFDEINFKTEWLEMPKEMNRAGHLVVNVNGKKGKRILLIGHLDTVFEEDSPFQKFTVVNDSIAHAPGGVDMKGGNVIVLYALKALYENGLLNDAEITAIFIGDEESSGTPNEVARKDLIQLAKKSDVALAFESSKGLNTATVARRGFVRWYLEVEGTRSHSSRIFNDNVGTGAILEISRILNSFYEELSSEEYFTFNPATILGGTNVEFDKSNSTGHTFGKRNVVAQKAVAQGEFRFISDEQKQNAMTKMKAIVADNRPKTSAKISFKVTGPLCNRRKGIMNCSRF